MTKQKLIISNARPIFKYYFYSTRLFFFIGWGLDKLAEHAESEQQPNQESQSTLLYRQLAQGLTAQLNEQPEKSRLGLDEVVTYL